MDRLGFYQMKTVQERPRDGVSQPDGGGRAVTSLLFGAGRARYAEHDGRVRAGQWPADVVCEACHLRRWGDWGEVTAAQTSRRTCLSSLGGHGSRDVGCGAGDGAMADYGG